MKDPEEKTLANEKLHKTYKSPSLTEYGNIRELTASGSNAKGEVGKPIPATRQLRP